MAKLKQEINEKLICAVEQYPPLYDKGSNEYKDRYKKEQCWENVANDIKIEGRYLYYYLNYNKNVIKLLVSSVGM